jgi:hypothetical protein
LTGKCKSNLNAPTFDSDCWLLEADSNKTSVDDTCTINEDPHKLYDPRRIDEHGNSINCFCFLFS